MKVKEYLEHKENITNCLYISKGNITSKLRDIPDDELSRYLENECEIVERSFSDVFDDRGFTEWYQRQLHVYAKSLELEKLGYIKIKENVLYNEEHETRIEFNIKDTMHEVSLHTSNESQLLFTSSEVIAILEDIKYFGWDKCIFRIYDEEL